jgi:predicted metal-dependent hydrolase
VSGPSHDAVDAPASGVGSGEQGALRDRREDGRPEQSRPRDRTGRPLPHGTRDVPLIEQTEPGTVEEALVLGVARWDERRYFEAHELLEFAWKHGPEEDRDLWKGVIQVAVAGVHLQRGNPIGARRLLDRALARLDALPEVRRGIDVASLRRSADAARGRLDSGELPAADWGPFPSCRDGAADGVWFAATAGAIAPSPQPTRIA